MKKDTTNCILAVIDNYNFCDRQTDRQTDMATLLPTPPSVGENCLEQFAIEDEDKLQEITAARTP